MKKKQKELEEAAEAKRKNVIIMFDLVGRKVSLLTSFPMNLMNEIPLKLKLETRHSKCFALTCGELFFHFLGRWL